MSSHHNTHFQAPPPIRTSTMDSQKSGNMSPGSDNLSPTSTYSRGPHSAKSPTEESFFSAITSRIRGRSRSRSRGGAARKRSKSPMVVPPEQFPASSNAHPMSPTYAAPHPQQPRHVSTASQGSIGSTSSKPMRPSLQGPERRSTSSSDMWRGRHSNSWLFNDYSVTEHAKGLFHGGRKS